MSDTTDVATWCVVEMLEEQKRWWEPENGEMSNLLFDVVIAAERRRQSQAEYLAAFPEAAELIARGELHPFTDLSVDAALAALAAHLRGGG